MWLTTQMHTAQCAHHTHTVCTPHTCHKHVPHTLYAHSCTQLLHVPHTRRILHAHLLLACRMAPSHLFCRIVDSLLLVLMLLPTANGLPHFRPTDHANLHSVRKPIGQKSIGESLFACFCEPLQQRQHQFSAHTLPLIFREDNRMVNQPPIGSDLLVGDPSKCLSFINNPENSFAISS